MVLFCFEDDVPVSLNHPFDTMYATRKGSLVEGFPDKVGLWENVWEIILLDSSCRRVPHTIFQASIPEGIGRLEK